MYYKFGYVTERKLETYTVKKIKENIFYLKGGYNFIFYLSDLGNIIFLSKKEAIENALKLHIELLEKQVKELKEKVKELKEEVKDLNLTHEEIKFLEKKLYLLKNKK